jgi:PAS domain S-box-containing protein
MRLFPNLPLRHRLTLISVVTSAVALFLTGVGFIAYEQFAFKEDLEHEVATTAQMIGYHSASALSFNDPKSAQETLQALGLHPHIEAACIYDIDGRVFAVYPQGFDATKVDRLPAGAPGKFGANRLELFRTIDLTGEAIGTIYLRTDLREMSDRLERYALIIGGVMLLAIVVAYVFALNLQRAISGPVAELATIAGRVGADNDFSARAVKNSNDELGQLIDGFNNMLGQIESRKAALRQAHDRLERRVQERTAELAGERARFKFIFDSVPVGISLATAGDLTSTLVNPAHVRITGIRMDDAVIPGVFVRATQPEDYSRQHELMQPFVRGEVEEYSVEKRYVHSDERVVWVILTSRRFIDPASGAEQSITTLVDITERKRARESSEPT